jgi:hypothetical protein
MPSLPSLSHRSLDWSLRPCPISILLHHLRVLRITVGAVCWVHRSSLRLAVPVTLEARVLYKKAELDDRRSQKLAHVRLARTGAAGQSIYAMYAQSNSGACLVLWSRCIARADSSGACCRDNTTCRHASTGPRLHMQTCALDSRNSFLFRDDHAYKASSWQQASDTRSNTPAHLRARGAQRGAI